MKLSDGVSNLPMVGPVYVKRLQKLNIFTIEDLLNHIPHRYIDYRTVSPIDKVQVGENLTVQGEIVTAKNIYTKNRKRIQLAEIKDKTGTIQAVWFNQTYLVRSLKKGRKFSFSGKIDWFDRKKTLISPDFEDLTNKNHSVHTARLVPVYPETAGVSSKWLRSRIDYTYERFSDKIMEFLPDAVLHKYSFPNYKIALSTVHFPKKLGEVENSVHRLAFNELLFHQLKSLYRKKDWETYKAVHKLKIDKKIFDKFTKSLPYKLTNSQKNAIKEIFNDLESDFPMNRLLEGDVGSGKTVVAAAAAFASFVNGFQSIFMAPTQILAQQHYKTLKDIFDKFKVRVTLVTSGGIKSDLGKSDIFVGTHALIHNKVNFDNVAVVVIDEQHRFGVEQRAHLVKKSGRKNRSVHVLTMTATPIPRSVALTVYGDLALSTLTELPIGRKPITTWLVPSRKRQGAYGWIKEQIKKLGVQAFIICPLIEESETESMKQVKAATEEFNELKHIFSDLKLDLLHGRQSAKQKDKVVTKFKNGKTDILVSTPVVEVGIDVPNATIMLIEAADRFGLAQLHQLRGRVGRGKEKSYCLLFTDSHSRKVNERLSALKKTMSGFELAELDLKLRGPGELFGVRQHGFPELKIATWQDTELIKNARNLAEEVISHPKNFVKLIDKLSSHDIIMN